jgi:MinD superfamily P-loop ATPase
MIISIASGKGGTGKTLVSTSLALSLQDREKVQLLDCDVEEPNDHIMLNPNITTREPVSIRVPRIDKDRCNYCGKCAEVCMYNALAVLNKHVLTFDELCHGCGACSYLCPEKAITEEEREIGIVETGYAGNIELIHGKLTIGEALAPPVIKKVKQHADPDKVVIIDVPPGTSCPVVESVKGSDFCLLVTEPTPFGFNDLVLAVELVRELNICCGIIINRAGVGNRDVEEYCLKEDIPIMLTIPLDHEIARLYSRGITLVAGLPEWKGDFIGLFEKIGDLVNGRTGSTKR